MQKRMLTRTRTTRQVSAANKTLCNQNAAVWDENARVLRDINRLENENEVLVAESQVSAALEVGDSARRNAPDARVAVLRMRGIGEKRG